MLKNYILMKDNIIKRIPPFSREDEVYKLLEQNDHQRNNILDLRQL